ncbi:MULTISPECIES: S1 family peptidase [Mycobacteroides]|uniref:S1 family peptidase n=1 Tax=Mycobacteroides TaxID=670516 RepID=UPI000AE3BD77|nr:MULTISPECIES: S1 family peptidase [Mycobacteroides]
MVKKLRTACTAALALSIVAVSACSTTVPGTAVPSAGVRATEKAAARYIDPPRYVDVSGTVTLPRDSRGGQYGARPYPGITAVQHQDDGSSKNCTLGPSVASARGLGFITAGHCDYSPGGHVFVFADPSAAEPILVGAYTEVEDFPTPSGYSDSAVIWTGTVDPAATRIANTWPITGVMPVSEVRQLPAGTPICIDGAKSGVVCSPLIGADDDFISSAPLTRHGDSGAAVFVVDQTGDATLLGIVSRTEQSRDESVFLEPALQRLGATALTAR